MTPPAPFDVVGLGENSVDFVYRVPGPLAANAKMRIDSRRVSPGGQVATTLCTCARFGLRASYAGTFGDDENGRIAREALHSFGVDTSHAATRPVPNRHAVIVVDANGERCVLWQREPELTMEPGEVPAPLIASARVLHVDNVDEEAAIAAARIARTAGIHVTTDVDAVTTRTPELIAAATIPIMAAQVPAALTGAAGPERALRLLRRDHDGMLCVTLGSDGALLLVGNELYRAPAFRVDAVDTTGAGDVFRGAFIYALLRGLTPQEILRFATAAAALSCTREGAIGGIPSLEEVEKLRRDSH
jgi:sugar/nucleoside kinase (ribokinase family)